MLVAHHHHAHQTEAAHHHHHHHADAKGHGGGSFNEFLSKAQATEAQPAQPAAQPAQPTAQPAQPAAREPHHHHVHPHLVPIHPVRCFASHHYHHPIKIVEFKSIQPINIQPVNIIKDLKSFLAKHDLLAATGDDKEKAKTIEDLLKLLEDIKSSLTEILKNKANNASDESATFESKRSMYA
ncbi:MAG: hypothetical protein FWC26_13985 [Fibromonadales bacterium]|nr:hypothetical protein [Fibromonadales bacterium]